MRYLPLVELILKHDYYPSGFSTDFSIEPDINTQIQLINYRCIIKKNAQGFVVYQMIDDKDQPFIGIHSANEFIFNMYLKNIEHANFTDLNQITSLEFDYIMYKNHDFTDEQEELTLSSIDLEASVNEFAKIKINLNNSKPKAVDHKKYFISFSANSLPWQYFLIENSNDATTQYLILDTAPNGVQKIVFEKIIVSENQLFKQLKAHHPESEIHCFSSTTSIRNHYSTRDNLQLCRGDETDVLLENLVNPQNANINRIKSTGEGATSQDYLYQVITYIT
jgi:hypothetical protein